MSQESYIARKSGGGLRTAVAAVCLFVAGGIAGVFGEAPVRSFFAQWVPPIQPEPVPSPMPPEPVPSPTQEIPTPPTPAQVIDTPAPTVTLPADFESWIGRSVTIGPDTYIDFLAGFPDPGENALAKDVGVVVRALKSHLPELNVDTACQALSQLEARAIEAKTVSLRMTLGLLRVPLESYLVATWQNALAPVPSSTSTEPGFLGMAERVDELLRQLFLEARAELSDSTFERVGRQLAQMLDSCTVGVRGANGDTRVQVAAVTNLQWFFGVCGGRTDHPAFGSLPIASEAGKSWLMPFRLPSNRLPTAEAASVQEMTEWLASYGRRRGGQLPLRAPLTTLSGHLSWPATHVVQPEGHALQMWLPVELVQRYWKVQYVFDELCQTSNRGQLAWVVNADRQSGTWSGFLRLAVKGP